MNGLGMLGDELENVNGNMELYLNTWQVKVWTWEVRDTILGGVPSGSTI
jgi:hypothetical protein